MKCIRDRPRFANSISMTVQEVRSQFSSILTDTWRGGKTILTAVRELLKARTVVLAQIVEQDE